MKKLLTTLFAMTVLMGTAWAETSADVLLWNLDTTHDAAAYDGASATRAFDTIKFWAIDPDGNRVNDLGARTYDGPEYLLDPSYDPVATGDTISVPADDAPTTGWGNYYTSLTGFGEGYSFWMELYNGSQLVDRMLNPLTWNDIADVAISATKASTELEPESLTPYNMASTMVPEPTSGLLLLFGGALLALRRRRVA